MRVSEGDPLMTLNQSAKSIFDEENADLSSLNYTTFQQILD
jgi:hypothetical protein